MSLKLAVLIDGGFLKKRVRRWIRESKKSEDDAHSLVLEFTRAISTHPLLRGYLLYRVFFYDGKPIENKKTKPLDGGIIDFKDTEEFHKSKELLKQLGNIPYVASRLGETKFRGWKIKPKKFKTKPEISEIVVKADDLRPQILQKGVDMRIGLDIAALSLKQFVDVLVLVSGDSDFVPALKFARTEGRQIILFTLGQRITQEFKTHADICVEDTLGDIMEP